MANARLDENGRETMIGLLSTDGSTITRATADATNALRVDDFVGGADLGDNISIDENERNVLWAVSSVDHTTPVPVYIDNNGKLLVQSS